jgi:hypothetical protein
MKELRVLTITFEEPIDREEISAFRGALIEKVGIEHEWFHNHNNDSSGSNYHYRYPMIQYKRHRGRPMLVFLDECIEEAQKLFSQADWTLNMRNKPYELKIDELRVHQFKVGVWEASFDYTLRDWLPITSKDYKAFSEMKYLSDRVEYLERKLANHVIGFAKGIDCQWEGRIEVRILNIFRDTLVQMKGTRVRAFSLDFETNFFLPNYIGLGKSASRGFGVVRSN